MVLSKSRRSSSKKSYKAKYSKKYPKVVKPKTGRALPTLRKYVLKQVHRNVENKMRMSGGSGLIMPTTHPNYQTHCIFPLTPYYEAGLSATQNLDITQGTGISNRIGNNITTRSGYLRAVIYPRAYGATDNVAPGPINVTFWIFKLKSGQTDSSGNVLATLQTNWFKNNNSVGGIQNNLADDVMIPNDSAVTILKRKVYKLGVSETVAGSGGVAAAQYQMNNDYKYNHIIRMNLTKYLRKKIKYQDNNTMPLTATTWLAITVAKADGSAFANNVQIPAAYNLEYDYRFEDA